MFHVRKSTNYSYPTLTSRCSYIVLIAGYEEITNIPAITIVVVVKLIIVSYKCLQLQCFTQIATAWLRLSYSTLYSVQRQKSSTRWIKLMVTYQQVTARYHTASSVLFINVHPGMSVSIISPHWIFLSIKWFFWIPFQSSSYYRKPIVITMSADQKTLERKTPLNYFWKFSIPQEIILF